MKATDVMNGVTLRLPPGIYEKVSVKDIVIGDRYYDIIFTNDLGIANKRE